MRNSSPVALGEIIAEKYQVEGVLGEGGMGLVVSAWHLGLRQRVAIKLLLSSGGGVHEDSAIERFQREARAAARIRSEHVCRVLDVGMLQSGTPYLVMEYLEGCDLSDELARRGRLPPQEAIGYVLEACEALAEAHMAGIIHRDLKPANLYLAQRPNGTRCLKLLDFGVSKSIADSSVAQFSLTKTSSLVGSPIYMSPEQLNSAKDVDVRTDIWALGALLYELITGRTPFYGESIPQLVSAVLNTEPKSFSELGISAPGGLEVVIKKALEKSRERRYASIGEMATALGPFAPDGSISISRILKIRPASDTRDPLPETVDEFHEQRARKTPRSGGRHTPPSTIPVPSASGQRRALSWALLVLLLIVVAGVAAMFSRRLVRENSEPYAVGNTRDAGASAAAAPPAQASLLAPEPPPPEPAIQPEARSAPFVESAEAGATKPAAELPRGRALPQLRPAKRAAPAPPPSDLDKFGGRR